MVKIVKEQVTKKYEYPLDNTNSVLVETIEQYHYDSEDEKVKHCKTMEEKGYSDSGQVKENIGSIMKDSYVWFGSYYKYYRVE